MFCVLLFSSWHFSPGNAIPAGQVIELGSEHIEWPSHLHSHVIRSWCSTLVTLANPNIGCRLVCIARGCPHSREHTKENTNSDLVDYCDLDVVVPMRIPTN